SRWSRRGPVALGRKKAPQVLRRTWGTALATCQTPYHLCGALLVQTDTDERAGAVVHGPVAPVLPDRHRVAPLGKWAEPEGPARWVATCPYTSRRPSCGCTTCCRLCRGSASWPCRAWG